MVIHRVRRAAVTGARDDGLHRRRRRNRPDQWIDEDGLYISLRDGIEGLSVEHVRSGQTFGEAELMWRCWECGELGRIEDDVPGECPNCGTEREDLYYWTED